jgi:hypothetical protein
VIIHQINFENITVFEAEDNAPVTADANAPVPFPVAFQRVQAISGKVYIGRTQGRIEMGQDIGDATNLIRPDLASVTVLKQML